VAIVCWRSLSIFPTMIGKYIFATEDTTLPIIVGKMLSERQQTIATAESCTGGYIAHLITAVPGSSAYYLGSTLTYAYEIKTSLLGIPQEMMTKHGAVSEEVVKAMAKNVREKLGSDYSISTSGIAGPTGGTPDKPVGTIWIAVASKDGVEAKMFQFGDNRERNIERTAQAALMMLRNSIAAQI